MLANLTTPLLGIVNTAAIGRLGEAHLIGGVALAAVVFDGIYWLFGFVRMGTVALTAQAGLYVPCPGYEPPAPPPPPEPGEDVDLVSTLEDEGSLPPAE